MSTANSPKRLRGGCPLCGKPASQHDSPFCSRGCRDRDLLNWLRDAYRVAGPEVDEPAPDFASDGLDSER